LAELIRKSLGFEECDNKTFKTGPNVMSMTQAIKYWRTLKSLPVSDYRDSCDDEEEPNNNDRAEKRPFSEEAFHCLETAMKSIEQQEECDADQ
ncbi:hypothetical protein AVEN_110984-2-1, partial [Araneus ventricosus]